MALNWGRQRAPTVRRALAILDPGGNPDRGSCADRRAHLGVTHAVPPQRETAAHAPCARCQRAAVRVARSDPASVGDGRGTGGRDERKRGEVQKPGRVRCRPRSRTVHVDLALARVRPSTGASRSARRAAEAGVVDIPGGAATDKRRADPERDGRPAAREAESDPRIIALAPDNQRRFAVYAERPLPADRRSRYQSSSAFAGLNYAVYFGKTERALDLLVTDLKHLPQTGTTAAEAIPFGTATLTLVMSPRASLEGALPQDLPWIIAVVGVMLSAGAALAALSLIIRRHDAEVLAVRLALTASENQRLYAEQRSIAKTLQHALLPDQLPQLPGTQASGLYQAGERGVDIGGDWYDVIGIDERRLLVVVGDVSGRGLKAATTMAELRYAIRAYAVQGDPPDAILTKLSQLLRTSVTGQLATILCVMFDAEQRELSVTSAGHLPPLLIDGGTGRFVHSDVGLPVGVDVDASYRSVTARLGEEGTLLAYTDGLVEHRGESLDEGLARLQEAATKETVPLPELLSKLLSELPASADDVAIVGCGGRCNGDSNGLLNDRGHGPGRASVALRSAASSTSATSTCWSRRSCSPWSNDRPV